MATREEYIRVIPEPMRIAPRWVLWKHVERKGKLEKVPLNLAGRYTDETLPENHASFVDALRAFEAKRGKVDGLGFALGDGWAGVDIDDCIDADGNLHPAAARIIDSMGTYAEVSPSRTGVKLFGLADLGNLQGNRRKGEDGGTPWGGDLEIYWAKRFFTVTAEALGGEPLDIADIQEPLAKLHSRWFPQPEPKPPTAPTPAPTNMSVQDLLNVAFAASNGAKKKRPLP